jgi:hypothetical protein
VAPHSLKHVTFRLINEVETSYIEFEYDNTAGQRMSGVFFDLRVKSGDILVAEQSVGPVTIDASVFYKKTLYYPKFSAQEGEKYKLYVSATEKGKEITSFDVPIIPEDKNKSLLTRISLYVLTAAIVSIVGLSIYKKNKKPKK